MAMAVLIPCLIYLLFETSQLAQTYSMLQANFTRLGHVYNELKDNMNTVKHSYDSSNHTLTAVYKILNALVDRGYRACPRTWIKFQRICYHISRKLETWQEANTSCASQNATLVMVNSEAQQEFLASFDKGNRWIGLNNLQNIQSFRWVNGEPLVTGYWSSNEPDKSKAKRCVRKTVDGTWKSDQCDNRYSYICQIRSINYIIQLLNLPFPIESQL
ncbi:CD209 antigen-like protein C [Stegostoma tigrinum]|uniref:CD209 antigen-like protein C n=1 Tax=Stegostoma tigrinum TaxID=3053191 RepID=UPI00202B2624|nr:CD209 antigen-like protein C [Stegostoma tigrinum]XP_059499229.1 CD209 antigen-like protein C [Stegostoma tigrinum]